MPPNISAQRKLHDTLREALSVKGFKPVDTRRLLEYMRRGDCPKEGMAALQGESILVMGNGRSSARVFMQLDPINETVRVLMANPRADQNASALGENELAYREEFRDVAESDIAGIAEKVAKRCERLAAYKDPKEFRVQSHIHAGKFFDGTPYLDDGVSNIADVVRRAALYNADVLVLTTHNSLDLGKFAVMEAVCRFFGITAVMGVELTAPLVQKHVNGPHLLLFVGDREAAQEVGASILSKREPFSMPSYFRSKDGMLLNDMLRKLDRLRGEGRAALGAAHPFNFNSRALPIKAVGLLSAVDEGQLSLETAISLAKTMDFIEVWNRSISPDPMKFDDPKLRKWIADLVLGEIFSNPSLAGAAEAKARFRLDQLMSANVCNLALGMFLEKQANVKSTFGTDDHCTPPLDWRYLRGGYPEAGFSFFRADKKPSAAEFVRKVADRSLDLSAHIYTATTGNGLQVADARTKIPDELDGVWKDLRTRHFLDYVRVLAQDLFGFIGNGEFDMIKKMDK